MSIVWGGVHTHAYLFKCFFLVYLLLDEIFSIHIIFSKFVFLFEAPTTIGTEKGEKSGWTRKPMAKLK